MNVGGGEAADQLVRMMLSGSEVAVRLSGSALKNLLALTMALARDHKKISGKLNMGKMLRETRDLRQFPMTPAQYKKFRKLAKKQKLLYSAIHDRDDRGKLIDVVLPVTELDRANMIFERILYAPEQEKQPERQPEKNEPDRTQEHFRDRPFPGREEQSKAPPQRNDQAKDAAPPREETPPKKDSRSERGSDGTKTRSSTPVKVSVTKTTSNRPSVEGRLKGYREQLDRAKKSAPTRIKAKEKPKTR